MSQRTQSTLILVAVFAIGLTAGVGAMVWAWPALRTHFQKPEQHVSLSEMMRKNLHLSDDQFAKVQQVVKDADAKRHVIAEKYTPQFNQICEDYTTTRQAERNEFEPVGQQADAAFRTILSDQQYQKYQADRAAAMRQRGATPNTVRRPAGLCSQGRGPGSVASPGGPPPGAPPASGGHLYY